MRQVPDQDDGLTPDQLRAGRRRQDHARHAQGTFDYFSRILSSTPHAPHATRTACCALLRAHTYRLLAVLIGACDPVVCPIHARVAGCCDCVLWPCAVAVLIRACNPMLCPIHACPSRLQDTNRVGYTAAKCDTATKAMKTITEMGWLHESKPKPTVQARFAKAFSGADETKPTTSWWPRLV